MERKKLKELLGAIFVAAIFLTSYAAFGNASPSQSSTSSTTTMLSQPTFPGIAHTSAAIISYGSSINIVIKCNNTTSVSNRLDSLLTSLNNNHSVASFVSQQASEILVLSGNESSYGIYSYLSSALGSSSMCTVFNSQANIRLPKNMTFNVTSLKTTVTPPIPANQRDYSVSVQLSPILSESVNVSVLALITQSGTIYGNMSVIRE